MRPGTEVALPAADITLVVQQAREVFLAQPMLLEVCIKKAAWVWSSKILIIFFDERRGMLQLGR